MCSSEEFVNTEGMSVGIGFMCVRVDSAPYRMS